MFLLLQHLISKPDTLFCLIIHSPLQVCVHWSFYSCCILMPLACTRAETLGDLWMVEWVAPGWPLLFGLPNAPATFCLSEAVFHSKRSWFSERSIFCSVCDACYQEDEWDVSLTDTVVIIKTTLTHHTILKRRWSIYFIQLDYFKRYLWYTCNYNCTCEIIWIQICKCYKKTKGEQ